jgi:hypothetical protein
LQPAGVQEEASAVRIEEAEECYVCCGPTECGDGSCAVYWSITADPTPAELHRSVIIVRKRGDLEIGICVF